MRRIINYAPSTFEERGAAVPFTTPVLSQVRVRRDDRNNLEVLIPNLSEGRGVYVVGWRALPDVFPMTMHDRHLHDALLAGGGCSPDHIRLAALEASRLGFAGPHAVAAAEAALREDADQRMVANYVIVLAVLRAAGLEPGELLRKAVGSKDGEAVAKAMMGDAARRINNMDPVDMMACVDELADSVHLVGMPPPNPPGRLRRLLARLEWFCGGMEAWSAANPCDAADLAAFTAEVGRFTVRCCRGILAALDPQLAVPDVLTAQWRHPRGPRRDIAESTARLSWLLDGWDFIVAMWDAALRGTRQDQVLAVGEIFRILPMVPREEIERQDQTIAASRISVMTNRSIRGYVDWRSGMPDTELIQRIESIKTKAVGGAAAPREAGAA